MPGLLNQGTAFDLRSLDTLKTAVKSDPSQGIHAVAKQMEGLFVQMMLKSMREASFKGGIMDSPQSNMFTSMYDQQISQDIASNGKLGFAELIVSQLTGEKVESGLHSDGLPVERSNNITHDRNVRMPTVEDISTRTDAAALRFAAGNGPQGFISRMLAPAMEAGRKSGIHHHLIIAQAALESGWGGREILTKEGKPSHNLFGIKATSNWKGETTEITTTEYINGVKQKVKDVFKVYSSYSAALADYTFLLNNNPRYKKIAEAPSPEIAAKALQSGGYATDPGYANKLIHIIQQVKNSGIKAVNAYKNDTSELF
ncbi:flagellar assembly peptidoglycan hydrolase FlgJ [Serratia fonticola]|uniref:flagellar assembly peptidoglycan hydrolase FlgJ n=1 Tax=Serratia fonticola TaxID=47917 RepID=UPI000429914E|nr:flagellar assembly peptidoglycan hydrolase FlgJ [Serratia fonticola]